MKLFVTSSQRNYEDGENYFSADNICATKSAAECFVKSEMKRAVAAEMNEYNAKTEDELKILCPSFSVTQNDNETIVVCGSHSYEWRVDEIVPNSLPRVSAKELGEMFMDCVNAFGLREKDFADEIARGHRTLQQSAMRLMMAAIKSLAESPTDDRNEAAVALAKAICALPEVQFGLPMV